MKTGKGLAEYAIAQLGRPYWWGCFGQRADGALYAQKKKQYPAYYTAADYTSQYGQKVHDCCGLIKGYLWCDTPDGSPKYNASQDVAVDGLYKKCSQRGNIGSIPETPGVCVFMQSMGHVGVYIGNGEVVEAMGHAYGVVKTNLKNRGWAYWGKPDWIEYGTATETASNNNSASNKSTQTTKTVTVTLPQLSKGSESETVRTVQRILISMGYGCGPDGADGDFGANTETAVKKFQRAKNLADDGIVGINTWTALLCA